MLLHIGLIKVLFLVMITIVCVFCRDHLVCFGADFRLELHFFIETTVQEHETHFAQNLRTN